MEIYNAHLMYILQNLDNVIKNLDICTVKIWTSVYYVCNENVHKSFSLK